MNWYILIACVGLAAGWCLRSPAENETCPKVVQHYDCDGEGHCDHRRSTLYKAMAVMAEAEEMQGGPA